MSGRKSGSWEMKKIKSEKLLQEKASFLTGAIFLKPTWILSGPNVAVSQGQVSGSIVPVSIFHFLLDSSNYVD